MGSLNLKKTSNTPDDVLSALRAPCYALMSLLMKAGFQRNALTASQVAVPPRTSSSENSKNIACAITGRVIPLTWYIGLCESLFLSEAAFLLG